MQTFPSTQSDLIVLLLKALPYPQHITGIDLREPNVVRFTWRGDTFRVNVHGGHFHAEQVQGGLLAGNNIAILLTALLYRAWLAADVTNYAATDAVSGRLALLPPA